MQPRSDIVFYGDGTSVIRVGWPAREEEEEVDGLWQCKLVHNKWKFSTALRGRKKTCVDLDSDD